MAPRLQNGPHGPVDGPAQAPVLRCRVVPGETRTLRAWPALVALLVLSAFLPSRVAADSSTSLRSKAADLSRQNANLAARSHSALLELYALDSQLAQERAHIVALRIRMAQVRAERKVAEVRLASARRSLAAAQRALSLRLQDLYEEGDPDPMAVVLNASSVSDALNSLDALDRVAAQDKLVIEQTRKANRRYHAETKALAAREHELHALEADALRTAAGLEQTRAARASYLASLDARRKLNTSAIAALEQQAQMVEARSRQLAAVASVQPGGGPPAPVVGGTTMTVTATGYSMRGHTATGAPVGWGVVAVDPSVVPLGTRMTIPGYGEGIAADTGSAVVGATIDVWFPTVAQARAWGRRTVTITLH
jgi:3D (Asp-Asp-Asp) domain-containing protein/peptidoglycan hydrolase CwlO-like protein